MQKERFKVLLVDDEQDFVESLSERLELRNLEAEEAYSGEEALAALAKGAPDVMVLDLRMPGIDGMEVLRRTRELHPDLRVIILTGHGTEKDEKEARKLGAFEYMQKPVDIDALDSTLRRAWHSLKRFKQDVDDTFMAASLTECGHPDLALEVLGETRKKDAKDTAR